MKCHECGRKLVHKKGRLRLPDSSVGYFTVDDVEYLECEKCEERLFTADACRKLEKARDRALRQM